MLLSCILADSFSIRKGIYYNIDEVLFILDEAILSYTFHFKYLPHTLRFLFLLEDLILLLLIHVFQVYPLFLHLIGKYLISAQLDSCQLSFVLVFMQLKYSHL